ncbi:LLM class flavin-dependent oxidoreductase [Schumannella soli]|uniref:LLM class flavin-dependent oxidoreductase n=1 Tax=Schumannella soli TaxID=2590779 RepID=A0A506XUZ5_9MICO|nr:LLM class flavin-dependent oxidoreductase [Schumannella soli]
MPRLGMTFDPTMPPERLLPLARAVEEAGLDELWVWEDCFAESGIAPAVAALAATTRIRVGIGLLPLPLRSTAITAMELATIDRMFPGRFIAGIGHGVQEWMGQAGVRVASPLTLLRESAEAMRRLFAGEEVTVEGRYVKLDRIKLTWPLDAPLELHVGGGGPKSLALAAEVGDGVLLGAPQTIGEVRAMAELAERTAGQPRPLGVGVITAVGEAGVERAAADAIAWRPEGLAAGEDYAAGTAEQIAERFRDYAEAGATRLIAQAPRHESVDDVEELVRVLGREVLPLLRR